jgi:hypothetical protein
VAELRASRDSWQAQAERFPRRRPREPSPCRARRLTSAHGLSAQCGVSRPEPRIHCLARVADAGRARLRAVGELLQEIGQLRVAVLLHEPRHVVVREPVAGRADDRQARPADIGEGKRAIARHGLMGVWGLKTFEATTVERLAASPGDGLGRSALHVNGRWHAKASDWSQKASGRCGSSAYGPSSHRALCSPLSPRRRGARPCSPIFLRDAPPSFRVGAGGRRRLVG